jgi:hypothetical protein
MPKKIEKLSFRIEFIEGLFVKYASSVDHKVPAIHLSARLQKRCVLCQKRGNTVYWCDVCGVRLCIECFRDYHTQLNF